jgi:hypothetical protein
MLPGIPSKTLEETMSKDVWIIGVDPPCPRCSLTKQRVERLAGELGLAVALRDLAYSDPEARSFARSIGKELGTAKHVAEKAGLDVDWDRVSAIVKNPPTRPPDFDQVTGPARRWSPEMDEALRPCQEGADSVGMLMTPIVIVDGEVKHHGSAPSLEQLRAWLA